MVGIFMFAVANALWLCAGLVSKELWYAPSHPLWLVLGLSIGWQCLVSLHATSFWRMWFGPPEIGEGMGRFIALCLLCLAMAPLWRVVHYRRVILGISFAAILVQTLLQASNPTTAEFNTPMGTFVPARFGEYLAFMAGSVWIAALCGGAVRVPFRYGLLVVFMVLVVGVSQNKSAMIVFPIALATSGFVACAMRFPVYQHFLKISHYWRMTAIVACFIPLLWVWFCVAYGGTLGTNPNDPLFSKDSGLGSRVALNQVVFSTLQHEPSRWLIGDGWGRFTDDIFKYALIDGAYFYHDGKISPNWTPLQGDAYHSHSQPMEVLLSLGLGGLLLWFAIPVVLLLKLREDHFWNTAPMLVAMVVLYYFWFELPQCLAFDALLLVSMCTASHEEKRLHPNRWYIPAIAVLGLVMAVSSYLQLQTMRFSDKLSDKEFHKPNDVITLNSVVANIVHGGDHLHNMVITFADELQGQKTITDDQRYFYTLLMNAAGIAAQSPSAGARLVSTELWMQYKLLIDFGKFPSFAELGHQAVLSITDSMMQVLRAAPLRDDYATFYLLNFDAITHGDKSRQEEILRQMLSITPNHRAALWVLGKLLQSQESRKDEGVRLMQRAASLGVDKVYPVTENELKEYLPPKR